MSVGDYFLEIRLRLRENERMAGKINESTNERA
jgi:hypothetical protein